MDQQKLQCTFSPKINDFDLSGQETDVVKRMQEQHLYYQDRLRKAQIDAQLKQEKECPFKPQITQYKSDPNKKKITNFSFEQRLAIQQILREKREKELAQLREKSVRRSHSIAPANGISERL